MNETTVNIKGKAITLSGQESPDYVQKIATFINEKYAECESKDGYKLLPSDIQNIMLDINIAEDYFKTKFQLEALQQEAEKAQREIINVRQQLDATNERLKVATQQVEELQQNAANNAIKILKLENELKKRQ